jgi:ribosomal protein L7Ae-like RNA K-turn-binding protein
MAAKSLRPEANEKLLGLIGLGLRGGRVVIGVDATRAVLQRRDAFVVVMASDASPRAVEKVVRLAAGTDVPTVVGPAALELGGRLGRPPVMVVAVRDRGLAAGILALTTDREGT